MKNFPACALLLALASCKTTVAEPPPGDAATRESIVVDGPSRVYARDGSVVASDGVVVQDAPVRAVGEREGSRTYLLELYQQALDAKDALALEVQAAYFGQHERHPGPGAEPAQVDGALAGLVQACHQAGHHARIEGAAMAAHQGDASRGAAVRLHRPAA